jgi:diacylglycerol kinase family enzyme
MGNFQCSEQRMQTSDFCVLCSVVAQTQQVGLVANSKAGQGFGTEELERLFASKGITAQVYDAPDPVEAARLAVADGMTMVIAAGGDGTISAVASVLAGTQVALGIVPTGTLNHLAKDLKIPLVLEEAVGIISRRKTEWVDIAEVNGRVFVNNSSLGVYPAMVMLRSDEESRGWNRWIALIRAMAGAVRNFPMLDVRLTAGGVTVERRTPLLFVGNNEYELEGLNLGTRSTLKGGQLFVAVAHAMSGFGLFRLFVRALFGKLRQSDELEEFPAAEAFVEVRRGVVRISTDGEAMWMKPPLHYRIRPQQLCVIVP